MALSTILRTICDTQPAVNSFWTAERLVTDALKFANVQMRHGMRVRGEQETYVNSPTMFPAQRYIPISAKKWTQSLGRLRLSTYSAHSAESTSACSSTSRVAFSCLSGG